VADGSGMDVVSFEGCAWKIRCLLSISAPALLRFTGCAEFATGLANGRGCSPFDSLRRLDGGARSGVRSRERALTVGVRWTEDGRAPPDARPV
jgi:hypothetical protein